MLYVRLNARRAAPAIAALLSVGSSGASAAPATTVVTLITGDRVTVDSAGGASVQPAADRAGISFQIVRSQGHIQVIPSDARQALRQGQVDPRLFDVTELTAAGYHRRATTPVIVTGLDSTTGGKGSSALTGSTQASVGRNLALVNGVAVAAAKDGTFWRSWNTARPSAASVAADTGTSKLWLDGRRRLSVEENLEQIGADVAHERGLLGDGVKVAVIDSGIDVTHPDLAGQVKAQKNFVADEEDDRDYVGHGTHVASVIAGTGAQSQGRYLGVAPHAELIDAKACSREGCLESAILESLEWAVDRGARIVNMSFGALDRRGDDLIEAAVNKLSKERGVLVVAAAGNDFVFGLPVGSPASADAALAVGSLSSFELPSDFSQRGRLGELTIKPELVAPGENITAARSHFMEQGEGPAEGYFTASGTSMAAPHVAGAAALLSQLHPEWKGHQLKAVLMGSAKQLDGQSALEQGAGLVNIPSALALQVRAEPTAVSFGRPRWPHDDDEPIEQKLTLHNESDEAVTLELTLELRGVDGASADPELFSLSDSKLEIAAHGKASVTLTANTRKGQDGLYSGSLVATGKDQVAGLHVPFVVDREVESYDLDLRFVDAQGEPLAADSAFSTIVHWTQSEMPTDVYVEDDSTATVRLARGSYAILSHAFDPGQMLTTHLVYPELTLDRDREVVMDGSRAKPLQIDAPLPEAERAFVGHSVDVANFGSGTIISGEGELLIGRLGPATDRKELGTTLSVAWIEPGAPEDSAYQFNWAKFLPGELFTGYHQSTELSDYAEVDTKLARGGSSAKTDFLAMGLPADPEAGYSQAGSSVAITAPGSRRMYYAADSALRWNMQLNQIDFEAGVFDMWEELARFEAGECYEQQWNQAVFGPAATTATFGVNIQRRYKDSFQIAPALLADHQGRSGGLAQSPTAHARLFRDDELIEGTNELSLFVDVPAQSARYRVEFELDRPAPAELSTHVELAWEFVSESSSEEGMALPLSYVRFLPELNQDSAAKKGATITLPIRVEPQPEAKVSAPESLTVEVSYDDGQSWSEVAIEGEGSERSAQLEHPQQSGYVSLRAAAIDADDNVVETTIIRAYRLQ